MKRFTETLKWQDPWFRRLSANAKMLWLYIIDHADHIGLVEIDEEFVSQDCGLKIADKHITELGDRIELVSGRKYYIPKFIQFQYGTLSESCPAHKKVIQSVKNNSLFCDSLGYHYPSTRVVDRVTDTLQNIDKDKDKDKEEDMEEDKNRNEPKGTVEEFQSYSLSLGLTENDGEFLHSYFEGNGWMRGKSPIKDWKAAFRTWKIQKWLPSQKEANHIKPRQLSQYDRL
jgi:hypothetical protein